MRVKARILQVCSMKRMPELTKKEIRPTTPGISVRGDLARVPHCIQDADGSRQGVGELLRGSGALPPAGGSCTR